MQASAAAAQAPAPEPPAAAAQAPAPEPPAASTQAPATAPSQAPPPTKTTSPLPPRELAAELYALVVYLHKNCNSDLFEAVGALELSLSQIKLLHHLDSAERELSLKQAAELVHVSFPAASRMVDDLVRRGFVEREEDIEDRRMKRVRLTETGGSAIRRLNAARLHGLEQFVHNLDQPERQAVAAALQTLLARPDIAACRPDQELAG